MPYPTQPTASHFINGTYVEDTAGAEIPVIYPATGEQIAVVHEATPAIVEQAITSAKAAQKAWAAMSGTERGRILRRAADMIRERNYDLSVLETYDTGKPMSETLYVDATSGADALEYFGGLAGSLTGEHIQLGEDWVYTLREALGLCVGIGAWNYPTQIACWKGAPALACGNAMIFKPSETTPLCALKVAEILHEAGLPAGLYNVIQGTGAVGAPLVTDPRVDKVSLTGSVPTGRKVYAAAAEGIKHVTMELGGKSPLIIFDDASLEDAVGVQFWLISTALAKSVPTARACLFKRASKRRSSSACMNACKPWLWAIHWMRPRTLVPWSQNAKCRLCKASSKKAKPKARGLCVAASELELKGFSSSQLFSRMSRTV